MDRRSFLKSTAALAVAALVPTWLRVPQTGRINLQAFCHPESHAGWKFYMAEPFVQPDALAMHHYATDGKVCVRIPSCGDLPHDQAKKFPPASRLHWTHDQERGWSPWPKQDWLMATDSSCLECDGYGHVGREVEECDKCEGLGSVWVGSNYAESYPKKCQKCKGAGEFNPAAICPACKGEAIGIRPGIQRVGGEFIDAKYDRLLRKELGDMDFKVIAHSPDVQKHNIDCGLLLIRFAGGTGMLCAMDRAGSRERIEGAK